RDSPPAWVMRVFTGRDCCNSWVRDGSIGRPSARVIGELRPGPVNPGGIRGRCRRLSDRPCSRSAKYWPWKGISGRGGSVKYREVNPGGELGRYIQCYWFLSSADAAAFEGQPILPDGRMELV